MSQSWKPDFKISINYRTNAIFKGSDLNQFLEFNVPNSAGFCSSGMIIFYFRVNYLGVVDSLYHEGDPDMKAAGIINQNILNTNGNWILPKITSTTNKCWFIFPYFILGGLNNCSDQDKKKHEQLLILRNLLSAFKFRADEKGRYLLAPNPIQSYSIK
ncbi:hypothetical protein Dfri01_34390 [Dyadobacter frigoris]|nr:hypothetical protein Dfri01_34390 [Dyadobacter frigoris]